MVVVVWWLYWVAPVLWQVPGNVGGFVLRGNGRLVKEGVI